MKHGCPDCRVPLVEKSYDQIVFKECPECAGLWILEKDLSTIEARDPHALAVIDSLDKPSKEPVYRSSARPCPECGLLMERFRFNRNTPIILDRCMCCEGIWVDDGELAQMASVLTPPVQQSPTPMYSTAEDLALKKAKAAELMAQFTAEHEARMARYRMFSALCGGLDRRRRNSLWFWGMD